LESTKKETAKTADEDLGLKWSEVILRVRIFSWARSLLPVRVLLTDAGMDIGKDIPAEIPLPHSSNSFPVDSGDDDEECE
jgi:hypothetical protein